MDINTIVRPLCVDSEENYYSIVKSYLAEFKAFAKAMGHEVTVGLKDEYAEFERVLLRNVEGATGILTDIEEFNSSAAKKKIRKLLETEVNRLGRNAMVSSYSPRTNTVLFRGRVDYSAIAHADSHLPSYEEFFHIPKSKRHLSGAYRFSSPGVPGLYLSTSVLTVYEELEKPIAFKPGVTPPSSPKYFNIIGMNVDMPIVLLDMRLPNLELLKFRIGKGVKTSIESLKRFLANLASLPFKIILHTRINRSNNSVTYKKEYHVPRILSDILLRERNKSSKRLSAFSTWDILGIHYSSTQVLVNPALKKECEEVSLRYDPSNIVLFPSVGHYSDYCPELIDRVFNTKKVLSASSIAEIVNTDKDISLRQMVIIENRILSDIEKDKF